jgi:hypothetical protein
MLNKTLGAVSFLFFFSFGLLSISFAACDYVAPTGLYQYVKFHHHKSHGLAQAERNNFKGSMLIEDEGLLPKPPQELSEIKESTEIPLTIPEIVLTSRILFTLKRATLNSSPVLNL